MAGTVWIAKQTDVRLIRELFPVRKRDTHKGDYGKVLLLCGSEGLTVREYGRQLLAESGNALLAAGVMPSAEQLEALGLTEAQARALMRK